jgi:organic hydroperoxide reductase OsmC/OhrA
MKKHQYSLQMNWVGNTGEGSASYNSYSRNHEYKVPGKPVLAGSSDPAFKGDPSRYNPEELLVASLSSCHMLWFLHLCSVNGIVVTSYEDRPVATMEEDANGAGRFTDAVLKPHVVITSGDPEKATALHHQAHEFCFIAQSVNFPVRCEGTITVENKL